MSYCHFSTNIGSFDYFFIISLNNIVACKNTEELANVFVAFNKYFKKYVNCFFFLSETPKRREKNIRSFLFLSAPGAPSSCRRPMDIGVIMDRSGSVGGNNFEKAKQFVISLVHKLQISSHGTRIGIIPYHSNAEVAVKFADVAYQTPDAMTRLIKGIPYTHGLTRTDIAIELANSQLFSNSGGRRIDKPNVLIVMTDGNTNPGSKSYSQVLALLKVS